MFFLPVFQPWMTVEAVCDSQGTKEKYWKLRKLFSIDYQLRVIHGFSLTTTTRKNTQLCRRLFIVISYLLKITIREYFFDQFFSRWLHITDILLKIPTKEYVFPTSFKLWITHICNNVLLMKFHYFVEECFLSSHVTCVLRLKNWSKKHTFLSLFSINYTTRQNT